MFPGSGGFLSTGFAGFWSPESDGFLCTAVAGFLPVVSGFRLIYVLVLLRPIAFRSESLIEVEDFGSIEGG